MTTYNTGNPIGSKDPRDLYDNAENLDEAVNTRTSESWDDRFGVARKTWWGMEQDFQQFLINSGYENIGDYAAGLEITARNQIFRHDGELYRAGAVLELPYATTGDWGDEEGLFVAVGDAALRQDLVQPVATFNNVADMRDSGGLGVGRKVRTLGYYTPGDGGGNDYEIVAAGTGTDDGGSFIDLDNGSQAKGLFGGSVSINAFGVSKTNTASDNGERFDAVSSAISDEKILVGSPGIYQTDRDFVIPKNVSVDCPAVVISGKDAGDAGFTDAVVYSSGGSETPLPALATDVDENTTDLVFSSSHNLSVGDDILLYDPADFSFSSWRAYYRQGEFATVSEIIDANTIRLEHKLYSGHIAADTSIYKMDFSKPRKFVIAAEAPGTGSDTVDGIILRKVAECDISGIKASGSSDSSLTLANCYKVWGNAVDAKQYGSGPATTRYGLKITNCQQMTISGEFAGQRHGCTKTGGHPAEYTIPNRGIRVSGVFTRSGRGTPGLAAADTHGNAEYCHYEGLCIGGGVNIAGDKLTADVTVIVGSENDGICVSAREPLGLNHDIKINATCYGTPNVRGAIDLGGNSQTFSENVERGGKTIIRGNLYCPENTQFAVRCRNAGSTVDWVLDVSDLNIDAPSVEYHLRIAALSGDDPYLITPIFRGVDSIDTVTTSNIVSKTINLPWKLGYGKTDPAYQIYVYRASVGEKKITDGLISYGTSSFRLGVQTVDNGDFPTEETLPFSWMMFFDNAPF